MNLPSKQKAVLYLAAVFLAGMITGVGVGYALGERAPRRFQPPEAKARSFAEKLRTELQLSEEQMAQVQPAFSELGRNLHALHTNTIEQVSALIRRTNFDIEKYLAPQQVEKLRRLQQEREAKFLQRTSSQSESQGQHPH